MVPMDMGRFLYWTKRHWRSRETKGGGQIFTLQVLEQVFFCVFYLGLGAHSITMTTLLFEVDFGFIDIIFIEVKYFREAWDMM